MRADFLHARPGRLSLLLVTEIPEHLLKRSQARRGAAGESAGDAAGSTAVATQAAAPAVAAPKAPAVPAGPAPAKPDSPVVAAYKARKKIPVWAMLTLSIFPVWAFLYVLALRPEPATAVGPLGAGVPLYSNCAGCHGAEGGGGVGYAFADGAVIASYPHIEDQLRWVKLGSDAYKSAGVDIPGDPNREGGPHITGASGVMPGWPSLTDAELLAVVCHVRYDLGGGDEESEEFALWCADDSPIYVALESGEATFDNVHEQFEGVIEIGSMPLPGTSADAAG